MFRLLIVKRLHFIAVIASLSSAINLNGLRFDFRHRVDKSTLTAGEPYIMVPHATRLRSPKSTTATPPFDKDNEIG